MKITFLLIFGLIARASLADESCSTIRLDQPSERVPNPPFAGAPVMAQLDLNICFSASLSALVDAERRAAGDSKTPLTSPLDGAIGAVVSDPVEAAVRMAAMNSDSRPMRGLYAIGRFDLSSFSKANPSQALIAGSQIRRVEAPEPKPEVAVPTSSRKSSEWREAYADAVRGKDFLLFEFGSICDSFDYWKKVGGTCPAQVHEVTTPIRTAWNRVLGWMGDAQAAAAVYRKEYAYNEGDVASPCVSQESLLNMEFPPADAIKAYYSQGARTELAQLKRDFVDRCTVRGRYPLPERLSCDFYSGSPSEPGSTSEQIMRHVDQALDQRRPQGSAIAFCGEFLYFGEDSKGCGGHVATVIGRQRRDGQCGFWIKDSMGTRCSVYDSSMQKYCESGKGMIWVPTNKLQKRISASAQLVKK